MGITPNREGAAGPGWGGSYSGLSGRGSVPAPAWPDTPCVPLTRLDQAAAGRGAEMGACVCRHTPPCTRGPGVPESFLLLASFQQQTPPQSPFLREDSPSGLTPVSLLCDREPSRAQPKARGFCCNVSQPPASTAGSPPCLSLESGALRNEAH